MDAEGFLYCSVSGRSNRVYWRCVYHNAKRGSCRAKAITAGFQIVRKNEEHNHKPGTPAIVRPHGNKKNFDH